MTVDDTRYTLGLPSIVDRQQSSDYFSITEIREEHPAHCTRYGILQARNDRGRERQVRQATTQRSSAWAAVQAVADEVEVPCREAGLTIYDFEIYDLRLG